MPRRQLDRARKWVNLVLCLSLSLSLSCLHRTTFRKEHVQVSDLSKGEPERLTMPSQQRGPNTSAMPPQTTPEHHQRIREASLLWRLAWTKTPPPIKFAEPDEGASGMSEVDILQPLSYRTNNTQHGVLVF